MVAGSKLGIALCLSRLGLEVGGQGALDRLSDIGRHLVYVFVEGLRDGVRGILRLEIRWSYSKQFGGS